MATVIDATNNEHLYYDAFSGRYFRANPTEVYEAFSRANEVITNEGELSLNDFYDLLGLPPIGLGDDLGWVEKFTHRLSSGLLLTGEPFVEVDANHRPNHQTFRRILG